MHQHAICDALLLLHFDEITTSKGEVEKSGVGGKELDLQGLASAYRLMFTQELADDRRATATSTSREENLIRSSGNLGHIRTIGVLGKSIVNRIRVVYQLFTTRLLGWD